MSNKEFFQKVFEEEYGEKKMKHQILLKYERIRKKKMNKIIKLAMVSMCLLFLFLIACPFQKEDIPLEENNIGTMKVYAYSMDENQTLEKTELKDNVTLGLASYHLAMSSVPGYPILFELNHLDYIDVTIIDGNILDWNRNTYEVKSLGSTYRLSSSGTLYFNVNANSIIKVIGVKNQKEIFQKTIIISENDFEYYATME